MYYSFVLISSPTLCNGKPFKRHKMFYVQKADGTEKEIFDVIAINCNSREDIPRMITHISSDYLAKAPTEENIKTSVWSSACRAVLMSETYGSPLNDNIVEILASFDINVNEANCIYIPIDGPTLSFMEYHIASQMLSPK